MSLDKETVQWLLASENPSVRYFALKDLLDEPGESARLEAEQKRMMSGTVASKLLTGQQSDGGFGVHPYTKWTGAHWRLVSLVEQGMRPRDRRGVRMARHVLEWLTSQQHQERIVEVEGRYRVHASQEGNALAACSRLGLTDQPVVQDVAERLVQWQWSDGGWNCDPRPMADHSSFHES
ncbi:MAG TPA: hypothetical protein VE177_05640, partial [Candidatus Binatus sp.]|nr:hypothetical protein [Candidatus Binatus sp.]